jgi:hypothetical protein
LVKSSHESHVEQGGAHFIGMQSYLQDKCRTLITTSSNERPAYDAALGKRLVSVSPGTVLTSII